MFQLCKIRKQQIGHQVKKDLKTQFHLLEGVYQGQELIIHMIKVMDTIYYLQIEILAWQRLGKTHSVINLVIKLSLQVQEVINYQVILDI